MLAEINNNLILGVCHQRNSQNRAFDSLYAVVFDVYIWLDIWDAYIVLVFNLSCPIINFVSCSHMMWEDTQSDKFYFYTWVYYIKNVLGLSLYN
jgi:hypothetical protein